MPYKKVSGSSRGSSSEPMISLRKSGSIGINTAALEEFFKDSHEYVEVFYDEENNKLGLLPKEEETDSTYTLTRSNSGGSVTPSSFLNSNGLVPPITTQYAPFEDSLNGDNTLVSIDIDEELGTYGSPDEEEQTEIEAEQTEVKQEQ